MIGKYLDFTRLATKQAGNQVSVTLPHAAPDALDSVLCIELGANHA